MTPINAPSLLNLTLSRSMLLVAVVVLTACAEGNRDLLPEADWQRGARLGKVVAIADADVLAPSPSCVRTSRRPDGPAPRLVKVRYEDTRMVYFIAASVEGGIAPAVGDDVEVWPQICAAGRQGLVTRVLRSTTQGPK